MDNLSMWTLLVGVFMPPAVAIIQQPKWSAGLRAVVTVVMSVLVGGATVWIQQGEVLFDKDLVGGILTVLVAGQATYMAFWKKTGIAPAVEKSTSPGGDVNP